MDALLLLGPLYHLVERAARLDALRSPPSPATGWGPVGRGHLPLRVAALEALRRPPGRSGIPGDRPARPGGRQHRNPTSQDYFTTTFFHPPDELRAEVAEAGFTVEAMLGVEGPGWALADLSARWANPARRSEILAAARAVESEPSLLGFHAHILAVGRVPSPAG